MKMKLKIIKHLGPLIITLSALLLTSCGVKGSPVSPAENPPIGTGKPSETLKKDDKKSPQKR